MYSAFNADAFGENTPVPEVDHVALVAEPPIDPSKTYELSEQITASSPAETITVSNKLIVTSSDTSVHGPEPSGSETVAVTVAIPARLSELDGK